MDRVEPRSANDYNDRTTSAVRSVLVEIGQILGSFEGKFAVIGGAVPWLLLSQAEMAHVGTADVDLALDPKALGDGEYARLVEMLQSQGYRQSPHLRRFQLARTVAANDGGPPIDIVVDFLMPRDAVIAKNSPPLVKQLRRPARRRGRTGVELLPDGRHRRRHARRWPQPCFHCRGVHPRAARDEGPRHRQTQKTQGRLRHLLLRAQLSWRHR